MNLQQILERALSALRGTEVKSTPTALRFKALGEGRWVAFFTNDFLDRDGEILSGKAQDAYVARVQAGLVPMPELWVWHTSGTRIGKALWVDRIGHMTYAVGVYDETPQAQEAEKAQLAAPSDALTLSHGFTYPRWARDKHGVYHEFNTFEISVLPAGKEANPFVTFEAVKELNAMPLDEQKKLFFGEMFGARAGEVIAAIEQQESLGKALADAGAAYKDFANVKAEGETPDDEEDEKKPVDEETAETDKYDDEEDKKATKDLLADIISAQSTVYSDVTGALKASQAVMRGIKAQMDAMQAEIMRLNTLLEVKPETASASAKTAIDPQSLAAKTANDAIAAKQSPTAGGKTVEELLFGSR